MLGLVTIFRDEEDWLGGMLRSTLGLVDKVYALSNGTQDRSRLICEQFCQRHGVPLVLMDEPVNAGYPDDLYNRMIEVAENDGCDIILLMDADERLSGHARQRLPAMIANQSVQAFALSRRTFISGYTPAAGMHLAQPTDSIEVNEQCFRLFRPGAIRFPDGTGPHRGPALRCPVESARYAAPNPAFILHERSGWEQLRRDKGRDQYPETALPAIWETLPGWFDWPASYDLMVANAREGGIIVELGCYLGRSLCYLGQKAYESGKGLRLYGVDTFRQDPVCYHHDEIGEVGARWLPSIAQNLHRAGLGDRVNLLQCLSWDGARMFDDGSLCGVWVDADHEYESVVQDIEAWWPKVRSGGYTGGHDYSAGVFPGVCQAVAEFSEREGLIVDGATSPGSWLVRKP